MRFCVNVSILFKEVPLLERFARAAMPASTPVEFWWPRGEGLARRAGRHPRRRRRRGAVQLRRGRHAGGRSRASQRSRRRGLPRERFRRARVGRAVGCPELNALVGLELPELEREEQLELARENVRLAADLAAAQGVEVLIEAVNTYDNGPICSRPPSGDRLRASVDRPNVRLQYDAYHMQRMEGNLTATMARHRRDRPHPGRRRPGRGEPGTGEINY